MDFFLEPAITYDSGETDVNYPSPLSNSTGTTSGFGIGARIGFHISEAFFQHGLDCECFFSNVALKTKGGSTFFAGYLKLQYLVGKDFFINL